MRKSSELEDDIKPDPLTEVLSPLVETGQPLCDAIQASNITPTSSKNSDIVADISRQEKPINLFIDEQELDQGLQKYFPVKDEIFEQQIDDHQICKKMPQDTEESPGKTKFQSKYDSLTNASLITSPSYHQSDSVMVDAQLSKSGVTLEKSTKVSRPSQLVHKLSKTLSPPANSAAEEFSLTSYTIPLKISLSTAEESGIGTDEEKSASTSSKRTSTSNNEKETSPRRMSTTDYKETQDSSTKSLKSEPSLVTDNLQSSEIGESSQFAEEASQIFESPKQETKLSDTKDPLTKLLEAATASLQASPYSSTSTSMSTSPVTPFMPPTSTATFSSTPSPRWATIIPLIGGSAIGCSQATGTKPLVHLTFQEFESNSAHLARYWPDVPFVNVSKGEPLPLLSSGLLHHLDFVTSVCPCSGLSMLNCSKDLGRGRGSDAGQNRWLIECAELVLGKIKPKVYWGENAPGLATKTGESMVRKMREIGQSHGYSLSLVKTNTELHGIPQRRIRCFYFYWRSPTAPLLPYVKVWKPDLISYLGQIPAWASHQDMFMTEGKASTKFRPYQFVLEREGLTHQEFSRLYGKGTISQYLLARQLVDDCIQWLEVNFPAEGFYNKRESKPGRSFIQYLKHTQMKVGKGKGYWDDSPRFMGCESWNAVIRKSMITAVHPVEDRYLNVREMMHLMGLPHDFTIDSAKNINHIAQNVPTCTARDYAELVMHFCKGNLEMTDCLFLKQDNTVQTVTERSREAVDPEEVAVLYIHKTGNKRKMLWGPLTKDEEGEPGEKCKKSEVIASCFLCPFLPKQTSNLRHLRAEVYRHYAIKHFRADLLSVVKATPPCPCPLCPSSRSGSKSHLSSGALVRHLAVKHGIVEAYLPPQFHIDLGRVDSDSERKIGDDQTKDIADAIQRTIEIGLAMADNKIMKEGEELQMKEVDKTKTKTKTLPQVRPFSFACTKCSETQDQATRRQVYLHYAVNHCQEEVNSK